MARYEVRASDNPDAMSLGTSTLSTHDTAEAAWKAIDRESSRYHRSRRGTENAYLSRIVVLVDDDGNETLVRSEDDA